MNEKTYTVRPPIGNVVVPKEMMTESELRAFVPNLAAHDAEDERVWREKAEKDPIEDIISWLRDAGYTVTEES